MDRLEYKCGYTKKVDRNDYHGPIDATYNPSSDHEHDDIYGLSIDKNDKENGIESEHGDESLITIFVRHYQEWTTKVDISVNDTICRLKHIISDKVGISIKSQILSYCGKILSMENNLTLYDYDILENGCIIDCSFRLKGTTKQCSIEFARQINESKDKNVTKLDDSNIKSPPISNAWMIEYSDNTSIDDLMKIVEKVNWFAEVSIDNILATEYPIGTSYTNTGMIKQKLSKHWKIELYSESKKCICGRSDKVAIYESNPESPKFTMIFVPNYGHDYDSLLSIWKLFLEDRRIISFNYRTDTMMDDKKMLNYLPNNCYFYNMRNYNTIKNCSISNFLYKNVLLVKSLPSILKSGVIPVEMKIVINNINISIKIDSNASQFDKKLEKLKMKTFYQLVNNHIKSKQIENMKVHLQASSDNNGVIGFEDSLKKSFANGNVLPFNIIYPKICFTILVEQNNKDRIYDKYICYCKNNIVGLFKVDCEKKQFVKIQLKGITAAMTQNLSLKDLINEIDTSIIENCGYYQIRHSKSKYLELSFHLKISNLPFTDTIKIEKIDDKLMNKLDSNNDNDDEKLDDGNMDDDRLACAICLESVYFDNYARLSDCMHKFHFECICNNVSYSEDNRCPLCRTKFTIVQQKQLIKDKNSTRYQLTAKRYQTLLKHGDGQSSDDDYFNDIDDNEENEDNGDNNDLRRFYRQWMESMNFFPNHCDTCNGDINSNDANFDIDNYLHCIECRTWYHTNCTNAALFAQCDQCMKCIHVACANNNQEWTQQENNNQQNSLWIHNPCQ